MSELRAGDRVRVTYETVVRQRRGDAAPWYFGQQFQGLGFEEILSHKVEVIEETSK